MAESGATIPQPVSHSAAPVKYEQHNMSFVRRLTLSDKGASRLASDSSSLSVKKQPLYKFHAEARKLWPHTPRL